MYPPELVAPMKEELTSVGFEDLTTVEQVDAAITAEGTTLVIINSVCGCAAANARPAAKMSISNDKKPNRITTVFAGVDGEAVKSSK
ncbi:MAG: BrxA/BrxB family bacilliredoxin, partial [Vicingaceae bacterium]|nr:BrxA/BrxB family bacilliredoxin [Vicingaceae bacterium]